MIDKRLCEGALSPTGGPRATTAKTLSLAATLLLALAVSACTEERGAGLGERCFDASECFSGRCNEVCVQPCATEADCVGTELCVGGECAASCGSDGRGDGSGARVCVDRVWVACDSVSGEDRYCGVCDGFCPGQRCDPGIGCTPFASEGEACSRDADCNTANCSLYAGVCRAPLGGPCDETNCDLCLSNSAGWSYCSRECGSAIGAPECPGGRCLGRAEQNYFFCRPDCGGDCPGGCAFSSDGSLRFCDFETSLVSPPRPLLAPCRTSGQCESGECLSSNECSRSSFDCTGNRGFCSAECVSDASCGDAGRCVDVPCVEGQTTGCGPRCLPSCESTTCPSIGAAECRSLPRLEGGEAEVCDPRNDDGEACRRDASCFSGNCSSQNRCVSAAGLTNGATCGADADCASGNCQDTTCRGTALLGEACVMTVDCAVGTCSGGLCT